MIWFGEKFNRFHLSNFKTYVRVNSSVLSYKHIDLHFTIHRCRLRFVFIFICGKVRQMKSQKMNKIFEFSFSFSSTVRNGLMMSRTVSVIGEVQLELYQYRSRYSYPIYRTGHADSERASAHHYHLCSPRAHGGSRQKSSQVKSSQVVGLRDRVAIIRTLIFSSPHPALPVIRLIGVEIPRPLGGTSAGQPATVTGPAAGS